MKKPTGSRKSRISVELEKPLSNETQQLNEPKKTRRKLKNTEGSPREPQEPDVKPIQNPKDFVQNPKDSKTESFCFVQTSRSVSKKSTKQSNSSSQKPPRERPPHLVKGSDAAKKRMAELRAMRTRKKEEN